MEENCVEFMKKIENLGNEGKFYFINEFDSNQTTFEYLSNMRLLGVQAPDETTAKCMLVFLRALTDFKDCPESYLNEVFGDAEYDEEEFFADIECEKYDTIEQVRKEQDEMRKKYLLKNNGRKYNPYWSHIWTGEEIYNALSDFI